MNYLKLKDNHISNFDIINNIKEFHDDYIIDINTTYMNKNFTIKESSIINKKIVRNSINTTNIKSSIKTNILNRYYSKKCRITWIINKNKKKLKSLNERRSSSSYNISSKKINNKNNEEEIEIELEMKIDKIKIDNFLIGYYFYFNRINKEKKQKKIR